MNKECSLCNELINIDNIFLTKCNHIFHQHCFIEYQFHFQKCAICQKDISEEIYDIKFLSPLAISLINSDNLISLKKQINAYHKPNLLYKIYRYTIIIFLIIFIFIFLFIIVLY